MSNITKVVLIVLAVCLAATMVLGFVAPKRANGEEGETNSDKVVYVPTTTYVNTYVTSTNVDKGFFPSNGWSQGNLGDGSSNRVTSDFIDLSDYANLTYVFVDYHGCDDYQILIRGYNDQKGSTNYYSGWIEASRLERILYVPTYLRIMVKRTDGADITPEEVSKLASISIRFAEASDRLRVISYNVGHYSYGVGSSAGYEGEDAASKLLNYKRFLSAYKPDVLCLQENYASFDSAKTLSTDTELYNPLFLYTSYGQLQTAIASKYAQNMMKSGYLGDGSRGYAKSYIHVGDKTVCVMSVHLTPGADSAATREAEIAALLELIKDEQYVIVCGDFNVADISELDSVTSAGYKLANGGYFGSVSTVHGSDTSFYDNVIVSPNIVIESVEAPDEVYDDLCSDHLPLIADLILY